MGQSCLGVLDRPRYAAARMRVFRGLDGSLEMRDPGLDMLAGLFLLGRIGVIERIDGVLYQRRWKVLLPLVDRFLCLRDRLL